MKRLAPFAILVALAGVALARPGGGESYSGGGGHDSGGGGGGGIIFELLYWTFRLILYYPAVGLPILCAIIAYVAYSAYQQHQNRDWDSGPPVDLHRALDLTVLRQDDPDFSNVVFEDFAFRLFSTAHRARPDKLATVAPYVSTAARAELAARPPTGAQVSQVIVGALRPIRIDRGERTSILIEFEANIATGAHTYFSVETWRFARTTATARSKPPGVARTFPCPNCGAPWQSNATGTQVCASCGEVVDNGRFDWLVEATSVASQDERPPTLTDNPPERGTDLPTYRQLDVDTRWMQLQADDPGLTFDALQARLVLIHRELSAAWSRNQLAPIRGYVSDGLFDYLQYWVDAYVRQGLHNALVDSRVTHTALAKIVRDRWYDALTLRMWATGKDFVVRSATGEVVRGSKHRERPYSEYWTLIRSSQRKGPAKADPTCGNCGAPLHISMAGACEHCGAHVTAGEFDWVLSKIEQDDSYRG